MATALGRPIGGHDPLGVQSMLIHQNFVDLLANKEPVLTETIIWKGLHVS
jgi:hypothetical protein